MSNLPIKEKPILFSGAMVRAILDGSKTQTRRIVKPNRSDDAFCLQDFNDGNGWWPYRSEDGESPFMDGNEYPLSCPFGAIGDQLWVRETYMPDAPRDGTWSDVEYYGCKGSKIDLIPKKYRLPKFCIYSASWSGGDLIGWKPPLHMPRWASRIQLEITGIRVERLNDITDVDAFAEGIDEEAAFSTGCTIDAARGVYSILWDSIYGLGSWDDNPWVWVIEFKRVKP